MSDDRLPTREQEDMTPNLGRVPGKWMERVQTVVTEAHEENLGGKHRSGFCEACADAYLVAQIAVPDDEPLRDAL